MSKVTLNDLTGFDFFKARESIGLTISKACEMTGISRNKLSPFEKEQATLPANDKRTLKRFYEERGHDFGDTRELDNDSVKAEYDANKAELEESVESLMPNEAAQALLNFVDSLDDVLTTHGYFEKQAVPTATSGKSEKILFDIDADAHTSLYKDYHATEQALVEHFAKDLKGEIKTGFFDNKTSRGAMLVAILAHNHLRLMAMQGFSVPVISTDVEWGTDGKSLLNVLKDCLERDALDVDSFNIKEISDA